MKKLLLLFLFVFEVPGAAAPHAWRFKDVFELIKTQSVEIQRSQLSKNITELEAAMMRRRNDPSLSAQAVYGWQNPEPAQPRYQTYSATLGYTFFDFGKTSAQLNYAEAQVKVKELTTEEVKEALYWSAARSYLAILSNQRIVNKLKESLDLVETRYKTQRRNYQQGLRSASDVASGETEFRRAQLSSQKAKDDLFFSIMELQQLAFVQEPENWKPDNFEIPETSVVSISIDKVVSLLAQWKNPLESPKQKRLNAQLESLKYQKSAMSSDRWPVVSGNVGVQESGDWSSLNSSQSAQLQISWKIPWNNMHGKELEKIALQQRDFELQIEQENNARKQHDHIVFMQLERLNKQLELLQGQSKTASRAYELVRRRYESGQASSLELTSAIEAMNAVKIEEVRLMNTIQYSLLNLAELRSISEIDALFFQ